MWTSYVGWLWWLGTWASYDGWAWTSYDEEEECGLVMMARYVD